MASRKTATTKPSVPATAPTAPTEQPPSASTAPVTETPAPKRRGRPPKSATAVAASTTAKATKPTTRRVKGQPLTVPSVTTGLTSAQDVADEQLAQQLQQARRADPDNFDPSKTSAQGSDDKAKEAAPVLTQEQIATIATQKQRRRALLLKVNMFYDIQRQRVAVGGRTGGQGKENIIALHDSDLAVLLMRKQELEVVEKNCLEAVIDHLKTIDFFVDVLSDKSRYKAIGPTMSGVLLGNIDFEIATTVSKIWAFAGLNPVSCFRCVRCNAVVENKDGLMIHSAHTCDRYKKGDTVPETDLRKSDRAIRSEKGQKRPYNLFLKTKLVGVLADLIIKLNSPWRTLYDSHKSKLLTAKNGTSDAHRHRMAARYMIKKLLIQIFEDWRAYHRLPRVLPYEEKFLPDTHPGIRLVPPLEEFLAAKRSAGVVLRRDQRDNEKLQAVKQGRRQEVPEDHFEQETSQEELDEELRLADM